MQAGKAVSGGTEPGVFTAPARVRQACRCIIRLEPAGLTPCCSFTLDPHVGLRVDLCQEIRRHMHLSHSLHLCTCRPVKLPLRHGYAKLVGASFGSNLPDSLPAAPLQTREGLCCATGSKPGKERLTGVDDEQSVQPLLRMEDLSGHLETFSC
jgi:hypothetical protein